MYAANSTDLTWDEGFGAMWLYGPHYTGWDNNWQEYLQFPDNPETAVLVHGMGSLNTFRTTPGEEVLRGVPNPPAII